MARICKTVQTGEASEGKPLLVSGHLENAAGAPGVETATSVNVPAMPEVIDPGVVHGPVQIGSAASVTGTIISTNAYFEVQWLIGGAEIPGADSPEYVPTDADDGKQLSARITAVSPEGAKASRYTDPVLVTYQAPRATAATVDVQLVLGEPAQIDLSSFLLGSGGEVGHVSGFIPGMDLVSGTLTGAPTEETSGRAYVADYRNTGGYAQTVANFIVRSDDAMQIDVGISPNGNPGYQQGWSGAATGNTVGAWTVDYVFAPNDQLRVGVKEGGVRKQIPGVDTMDVTIETWPTPGGETPITVVWNDQSQQYAGNAPGLTAYLTGLDGNTLSVGGIISALKAAVGGSIEPQPNDTLQFAADDTVFVEFEASDASVPARTAITDYAPTVTPVDPFDRWAMMGAQEGVPGVASGGKTSVEQTFLPVAEILPNALSDFVMPSNSADPSSTPADDPASYTVTVNGAAATITAIYRRTKPIQTLIVGPKSRDSTYRHQIALKLSAPIPMGAVVHVSGGSAVDMTGVKTDKRRSPSVHVAQTGYVSEGPIKAFVGLWLGQSSDEIDGTIDDRLADGIKWNLVDHATDAVITSGTLTLSKGRADPHQGTENFNGCDVYLADASGEVVPDGQYRFEVAGIGSSYPFPVMANPAEPVLRLVMRGLGLWKAVGHEVDAAHAEGGPVRPAADRPMLAIPTDVTLSGYSEGGGLIDGSYQALWDAFKPFESDAATVPMNGGLMDAGDWDLRISAVETLVEHIARVVETFDWVRVIDANLPDSGKKMSDAPRHQLDASDTGDGTTVLSDLTHIALLALQPWTSTQGADGRIGGGFEYSLDGLFGSKSYDPAELRFAYAAEPIAGFHYAAAAALLGRVIRDVEGDAVKGASLIDSAERAFLWAEGELDSAEKWRDPGEKLVATPRIAAAATLFRANGNATAKQIFEDHNPFAPGVDAFGVARGDVMPAAIDYAAANGRQDFIAASIDNWILNIRSEDEMGSDWGIHGSRVYPWGQGWKAFGPGCAGSNRRRVWQSFRFGAASPACCIESIEATFFLGGCNNDNLGLITGLDIAGPVFRQPTIVDRLHEQPEPGIPNFGTRTGTMTATNTYAQMWPLQADWPKHTIPGENAANISTSECGLQSNWASDIMSLAFAGHNILQIAGSGVLGADYAATSAPTVTVESGNAFDAIVAGDVLVATPATWTRNGFPYNPPAGSLTSAWYLTPVSGAAQVVSNDPRLVADASMENGILAFVQEINPSDNNSDDAVSASSPQLNVIPAGGPAQQAPKLTATDLTIPDSDYVSGGSGLFSANVNIDPSLTSQAGFWIIWSTDKTDPPRPDKTEAVRKTATPDVWELWYTNQATGDGDWHRFRENDARLSGRLRFQWGTDALTASPWSDPYDVPEPAGDVTQPIPPDPDDVTWRTYMHQPENPSQIPGFKRGQGGMQVQFGFKIARHPLDPNNVQFVADVGMILATDHVDGAGRIIFRPRAAVGLTNRWAINVVGDPTTPNRWLYVLGNQSKGSGGAGIHRSSDNGNSLENVLPLGDVPSGGGRAYGLEHRYANECLKFCPSKPARVYFANTSFSYSAGSGSGQIYRSDKNGDKGSWQTRSTAAQVDKMGKLFWLEPHPTDPDELLMGAENGLFRSTDGGATWSKVAGLPNVPITGIQWSLSNPAHIRVSAYRDGVYETTNGGGKWTRIWAGNIGKLDGPGFDMSRGIYFCVNQPGATNSLRVKGTNRKTLVPGQDVIYDNFGFGTPEFAPWHGRFRVKGEGDAHQQMLANVAWNPDDVDDILVNNSCVIFRSLNGGDTFENASYGYNGLAGGENKNSIYFPDDQAGTKPNLAKRVGWAFFDYGGYLEINGPGQKMIKLNIPSGPWSNTGSGFGVAISPKLNGDMLFVMGDYGAKKQICHSPDWGQSVDYQSNGNGFRGNTLCEYNRQNGDDAYTDKEYSGDGGKTWKRYDQLPNASGLDFNYSNNARLIGVCMDHGEVLWAIGNDQRSLYRSTNKGVKWTKVYTFGFSVGSNFTDFEPHPNDPTKCYFYENELKLFTVGGNVISLGLPGKGRVTNIVPCRVDPQEFLIFKQVNGSAECCWHTGDGGNTWTDVSKNLPRIRAMRAVLQNHKTRDYWAMGTDGPFVMPSPKDASKSEVLTILADVAV